MRASWVESAQRVAMRLTEPANDIDDLYFVHGDQSGSTVLITDDTGQEVGRAHYEPFGETFSSTIPVTLTERLFSGQVLDSLTGLYYYGNGRYYDPSIGRYISPDPYLDAPFSSQRLDRYNFGFNNHPHLLSSPLKEEEKSAPAEACRVPGRRPTMRFYHSPPLRAGVLELIEGGRSGG